MTAPVEISPEVEKLRGASRWSQIVCYHEAGHVLACHEFDIATGAVQMDWGVFTLAGGHVEIKGDQFERDARNEAVMCMAGQAAEEVLSGLRGWDFRMMPLQQDYTDCFEILKRGRVNLTVQGAHRLGIELVRPRWGQLETLAARLLVRRRLTQEQARKIADQAKGTMIK